jgi:hypothetical protein
MTTVVAQVLPAHKRAHSADLHAHCPRFKQFFADDPRLWRTADDIRLEIERRGKLRGAGAAETVVALSRETAA